MATYQYATVAPIAMPAKSAYYHPTPISRTYGVSPPESAAASVASGPTYSTASNYSGRSSYAGSDCDSRSSSNSVDLEDFVSDRFSQISFDPLPLDRSLAKQAQASGKLNNKQREVEEMRAKAQARLAKSRVRMQQGFKDAKQVKRDLEWSQEHVSKLTSKMRNQHPEEYKQASRQRYPAAHYE